MLEHKRKTIRITLILMAVCISLLSGMQIKLLAQAAQTAQGTYPTTPLLVGIQNNQSNDYEGDVWAWGGSEWIQRTATGHTSWPVVSPTGHFFAYVQTSPVYIEYVKQISNSKNNHPTDNIVRVEDISLWDLTTAQAIPIAIQPSNASLENGKARFALHSMPAWSPDGKSLAWTEISTDLAAGLNTDLKDESLIVYDMAARKATTVVPQLASHTFYQNIPYMSQVSFGPDNVLAVRVHVTREDANEYFYDLGGNKLAEVDHLSKSDPGFLYGDVIWLSGLDKAYLSCINCKTKIDPQTGTVSPLNGSPEMYSSLAPDNLSFYYGKDSGTESNTTWVIAFNGKQVGKFASARMALLSDAAIAPDGMIIAAAEFKGQGGSPNIAIFEAWNHRILSDNASILGMGWGPIAWRVHPSSTALLN